MSAKSLKTAFSLCKLTSNILFEQRFKGKKLYKIYHFPNNFYKWICANRKNSDERTP